MVSGTVDVILMASGFSARFGEENKLLTPFRGTPLLARALELVLELGCFESILLVWGQPQAAALARGLPVQAILNSSPHRGIRESVRLGVEASRAEHYLFLPCDQPLLDAATVNAVLGERGEGLIIVPEHRGRPGNPTLFSARFRQELLNLSDGEAPRILKERHPEAVRRVEIPSGWPLADIDTPDDLRHLEENAP